jgi:hypothetical protein
VSRAGVVLSLVMRYALSPNFDALTIYAAPMLWPNPGAFTANGGLDRKKSLYRNNLQFTVSLAAPAKTLEQNREQWAAGNGALLRTALARAAHEIAVAVVYDMTQGPILVPACSEDVVLADGYSGTRDRQGALLFKITTQNLPSTPAVAAVPMTVSMPAPAPVRERIVAPAVAPAPAAAVAAPMPVSAPAAPLAAPAAPAMSTAPVVAATAAMPRTRSATALRRQPSLDGARERPLPAGTAVRIEATVPNAQGTWMFVSIGGDSGWLQANELVLP